MSKVRRRKRFYLSLVAALLLFLCVGTLVALVHLTRTIPVREEPPELVAKRLDTENNAYYTLMEAVKLLPECPEALMLKDEDGWDYEYYPEPDSIGEILRVRRPDDDPVLLEYVSKSKPATDLALRALEKPWFLHSPEPEAGPQTEKEKLWAVFEPQWWVTQDRRAMWRLVRLLQVRALVDPCSDDPETDGCLRLIESFRLAGLINHDGIQDDVLNPRLGVNIIRKTRPDHRRRAVEWLSEMRNAYVPGRDLNVMIEDVYGTSVSNILPGEPTGILRVFMSGILWREKLFVRRHEPLLRKAAAMTCKQYEDLKAEHPVLEKADEAFFGHSDILDMPFKNSMFSATVDGVSIALALELCKQDTGAYPDSLETLVPKYLPDMPENPYTGGPFTYKRVENDYVLSCIEKGREPYHNGKESVLHAP